jgi:hypothetical protein
MKKFIQHFFLTFIDKALIIFELIFFVELILSIMFIMNLWKHNEIFKKEVPQRQTSEESLISKSKTDSSIESLNSTKSETQRSI